MRDKALPGAALLLSEDATDALAPAVAAAGGELLSAWPSEVRYDPGRRLAVRYGATVAWGVETPRTETLGALVTTGDVPDELSIVVGPAGERVGIWRYPHDPFLPGLPHAAYPAGARGLLARMGLGEAAVAVEPLVYRPGSRAVLRLEASGRTFYAKVLRPQRVSRLLSAHRALERHLPVPKALAWSEPLGLLVVDGLPGEPLTRALVDGGALPDPVELLDLLERLAPLELPGAPAPAHGAVKRFGAVLAGALPELEAEIGRLVAEAAELGGGAPRLTHGDFYEAQLLTVDGAVSGLLDLDGVGVGGAVDDVATLLGHMVGLAHVHPSAAERVLSYARALTEAAAPGLRANGVDAELLRRSVTGVLLGLATTPFRRQEPDWRERTAAWIATAARWAAGEEALTSLPSPPHEAAPA